MYGNVGATNNNQLELYQIDMEPVQLRYFGGFNFSSYLVFDLWVLKVDGMCQEMTPLQCIQQPNQLFAFTKLATRD